jgi:CheY-like chemotaxis protein
MTRNGTGLGLSIARELVKMMGGAISVRSEGIEGRGTTFSFHVILEEEIRIDTLKAKHREIIAGSKILIVDDRSEIRMQLTDMLFKWECIPTAVSSGEEALQYLRHNIDFDTAIVDICMPYMSGVELAHELKLNHRTMPIIALSSVELGADSTHIFDFYMNKPIDQNLLFPALLMCLNKRWEFSTNKLLSKPILVPTPPPRRSPRPKEKLRILIAEDDANNTYTMKEMLSYLGFSADRIKTVSNGQKCVAEVQRRPYDVILMDLVMPVMDGIEATKHIRQLKRRPYIIAISAASQNTDKQRCQQVGIDGYLSKPILKERLLAALLPFVDEVQDDDLKS